MDTLRDVVKRLDELDDEGVIYTDGSSPAARAAVVTDAAPKETKAAGLRYFIEVALAKDAVVVWSEWRGSEPASAGLDAAFIDNLDLPSAALALGLMNPTVKGFELEFHGENAQTVRITTKPDSLVHGLLTVPIVATDPVARIALFINNVKFTDAPGKTMNAQVQIGEYIRLMRFKAVGYDAAGNDTGPGWGWAAMILPQLDQSNAFSAVRFDLPIEHTLNQNARLNVFPVLPCWELYWL